MGTFTIDIQTTEQEMMEYLLNCTAQTNIDWMLILSFYALGTRMHKDKLLYYIKMLEEVENE